MKPLGEKFTSWNRYFTVNDLLCPTCPQKLACPKFTLLSFYYNCAYYPGLKPGKKYALNKQYALLSQFRLLTCVYGIVLAEKLKNRISLNHLLEGQTKKGVLYQQYTICVTIFGAGITGLECYVLHVVRRFYLSRPFICALGEPQQQRKCTKFHASYMQKDEASQCTL